MKIFKNKYFKQMIIIITLIFVIFNVITPPKVYADKSQDGIIWNIGEKLGGKVKHLVGGSTTMSGDTTYSIGNVFGNIIKDFIYFVVGIGDAVMAAMQVTILGDSHFWSSTMISNKNDNLEDPNSWLYATAADAEALSDGGTSDRGSMLVLVADDGLKNGFFGNWKVPNLLYSPENIFSNKIAALDANYINPHEYTEVNDSDESREEAKSFAKAIRPTIASWYRAFRNLAIVGLLSVLVYLGIRILIGTVTEKAKYKQRLQDWFVALCLVFFIHFIMAGIMMFAEKITELLSNAMNNGIIVSVDDGTVFRTNLTGYIRFAAQSDSWIESLGYSLMYITLVGIILRYTFIYIKRALYLGFFTVIAPLVAITYPIDKAGDGQAQAFNTWIKEYFINAILQPFHFVIFALFEGVSLMLVEQNPIYGIVVLLFMSTAEKWLKAMFKMDQAKLTSTSIGDVAVLSSMMNFGKNVAGGIGKTVATAGAVGITALTGGTGGGAALKVAKKAGAGVLGLAKGAGSLAASAATGSGGTDAVDALLGGTVEETVNTAGQGQGGGTNESEDSKRDQYYNEMKQKVDQLGNKIDKVKDVQDSNRQAIDKQTQRIDMNGQRGGNSIDPEYARQKDLQDINNHTIDVNTIGENAPTPASLGETNIDDISGVENNKINTVENEIELGKDADKYFSSQEKDRLIKSITGGDSAADELKDMLAKGVTGTLRSSSRYSRRNVYGWSYR